MDWWGTLNQNSGAVQAGAAVVVAVLTVALVFITKQYADTTREQIRQGARPALIIRGDALCDQIDAEHEFLGLGDQPPIQIENVGKGPAVPRTHTYRDRADVKEPVWLYHGQGSERGQIVLGDGFLITLWYDDMYGHHYRDKCRRQGYRWILDKREKIKKDRKSVV